MDMDIAAAPHAPAGTYDFAAAVDAVVPQPSLQEGAAEQLDDQQGLPVGPTVQVFMPCTSHTVVLPTPWNGVSAPQLMGPLRL